MAGKPKLAIVVGELTKPRFLALFDGLRSHFDVQVFALEAPGLIDSHGTGLKLTVFETIDDMPGYMRGLEEMIAGVDCILGLETSRLSTFQAVRAARKFGIPFGVVVNEYHPYFYSEYANIRAIQYDICNKARTFWVTSDLARKSLLLDSVPEGSIERLNPVVGRRFMPNPALRAKFRNYINVGMDETVLLYQGDLEPYSNVKHVILAMALLRRENIAGADKLRLIIAGNGSSAMDLKYLSADSQCGAQVMFLHQDPEPFLVDLYSATDIMVWPSPSKVEFHEDLPLQVLEAMASGVVPVVEKGSVVHELCGDGAVIAEDGAYRSLAMALHGLVSSGSAMEVARSKALSRAQSVHTSDFVSGKFAESILAMMEENIEVATINVDLKALVRDVDVDLRNGRDKDALVKVEEAILCEPPSATDRAILHSLKGDVYYSRGSYDEAFIGYSEAVKLDDHCSVAYRGLGFVAWQGHSHEEALTFFRKALAQDEDASTMLGIGLTYRRLGLVEEAIYWLEKSLNKNAEQPTALMAISQVCMECHIPSHGIEVLERVMEATGERSSLLMSLGQLYVKDGRPETGNAIIQRALDAA